MIMFVPGCIILSYSPDLFDWRDVTLSIKFKDLQYSTPSTKLNTAKLTQQYCLSKTIFFISG